MYGKGQISDVEARLKARSKSLRKLGSGQVSNIEARSKSLRKPGSGQVSDIEFTRGKPKNRGK